jgi:NifU-like protein involved in Fe-S cluster formation
MNILIAILILFCLIAAWFTLYYIGNQQVENPDGTARITGNCGDTMEIALRIRDGRVMATSFWTDGCSVSKSCVETAALLARGKAIKEVRAINMMTIMDEVGQLPDTHLHCAQLAETTLQRAVQDYLARCGPTSCSRC